MKKSFFMLVVLFICGMVSADVCLDILKGSSALLDINMYQNYATAELVYRDIFWNILYERIKLFAFLLLLCFTPLQRYIGIFYVCIFSFVWGFYIMTCVMQLGIAGVVVGIASVLPHGVLYLALLMMMLGSGEGRTYSYYNQNNIGRDILNFISGGLLLITGCVLESIVSTHFIPWVIRLSMI